ncbi:hypothetical protein Tco_0429355 [Tanacetum coccineum]
MMGMQNQLDNIANLLSKMVVSNTASTSGSGSLPGNTVTNPKEDLKGITTRSGVTTQGPTIPPTTSTSMNRKRVTKDTMPRLTIEKTKRRPTSGCASPISKSNLQARSDFVVVEFEPDPRVPLILGRCFLKTSRALIDVYEGEITLRVGKEAITFNLDQTSRYTANFNHMTANRIDVIDMASEEYSQEVLGFSDSVAYGNPSPCFDPIVANSSPTLTPFGESDFLLFEEANAFLSR